MIAFAKSKFVQGVQKIGVEKFTKQHEEQRTMIHKFIILRQRVNSHKAAYIAYFSAYSFASNWLLAKWNFVA